MTPEEQLEECPPADESAALAVVDAYLALRGDLTAEALHHLAVLQDDPLGFMRRAKARRRAWFGARGVSLPPLRGERRD